MRSLIYNQNKAGQRSIKQPAPLKAKTSGKK